MRGEEGAFETLVNLVRDEMNAPEGKPPEVALVLRVEPGRVELHIEAKGEQVEGTARECGTDAVARQSLDSLAQPILSDLAEIALRREAARPKRKA